MHWSINNFWDAIGLAPQDHKHYKKKKLHIDKGEVNPENFSAQSIITSAETNGKGHIQSLNLRRWVMAPDGQYDLEKLFELETDFNNDKKVIIKSLHIMGHRISLHNQSALINAIGAIKEINTALRRKDPENSQQSKIPDIKKIFKKYYLQSLTGESFYFADNHIKAKSDFDLKKDGQDAINFELPLEMLRPLLGANKNTLDSGSSLISTRRDFNRAAGVIPEISKNFVAETTLKRTEDKAREILLKTWPANDETLKNGFEIVKAKWSREYKIQKNGEKFAVAKLENLEFLGQNVMRMGYRAIMGTMGILNRTNGDMLNFRGYPKILEYLPKYSMVEIANAAANPPESIEGELILTSMGGNNLDEIYHGAGNEIGGNSKAIEKRYIDPKTAEVKKIGVIFDLGLGLVKNSKEWTGWIPDVSEKLSYCTNIFLNHHHLDHKDGLKFLIKSGHINKSHTLHMTPEVHEMYNDMMVKAGVKRDDERRPKINLLEGTDTVDIYDNDGERHLTVLYGADAVSHSARATPFTVYGRSGKKIIGSVQYLGDANYNKEWEDNCDSRYKNPVAVMQEKEPYLKSEDCIATYTTIDSTNANKDGFAPTEKDVVKNTTHMLNHWFDDKHALTFMIGTNDSRRESFLKIGTLSQRLMTTVGAAVSFLFRVANKHGVNPYIVERPQKRKYTGIDDYLSYYSKKIGQKATQFKGRTSKAVKSWFKNEKPGKLLVVATGSQGTEIERLSTSSKLARHASIFDQDPKKSKYSLPANLRKDWVIIFSQTQIPGNNNAQKKLIEKLKRRGAPVVESLSHDTRIHNAGRLLPKIKADLEKNNYKFHVEQDGSLYIKDFEIHATGHGYLEDMRLRVQNTQSKFWGVTHTDNKDAVIRTLNMFDEEGKKHAGQMFKNHTEVRVTKDSVQPIGETMPSVIMIKEEFVKGRPYNPKTFAQKFFNMSMSSPHHKMGLSGQNSGVIKSHFGSIGIDELEIQQKEGRIIDEEKDLIPLKKSSYEPYTPPQSDAPGQDFSL